MTASGANHSASNPERRSPGSRAQRFLAQAGEILAASLHYEETLASITRLAVPAIADWSSVNLVSDTNEIVRVAFTHVDPGKNAVLEELRASYTPRLDADHPLATTIRTDRPTLIERLTDDHLRAFTEDEDHLNLERALGTHSVVVAPLTIRGRVLGAITLASSSSKRVYTDADVAMAVDLGRRAAVAIDNARLYREAREAEARVRHQASRLEALAEASQAFAMARLDLDAVLSTVTRRVAELLGDVCSIRLVSDDGQMILPVAFHHTNPAAFEVFKRLRSFGPRPVFEGTIGQVMQTGEPLLIAHRSLDDWRPTILPDWIPYVEQFGMHSLLIVPLRAGGTTIGTLGLWRESTPQAFTLDDQRFVQDLADRAGLAVDNARLYRASQAESSANAQLFAEAQAAVASRDEFLSVAAHELKTPVTSLRGYAQLLLRQIDRGGSIPPERLRRALASIDRQTLRLSALISQLLDTSRIQAGELTLEVGPTDIVQLIADLVEHTTTLSEEYSIIVDADPPLIAEVDSLRIEQVLTNLIDNAIKYGSDTVTIRIAAGLTADGQLRIAVEDNGPGIPDVERERIFERFYQVDSAGNAVGMGLGLYISRQIIALHGGTIDVETSDDGGTRFVIHVPAKQPDAETSPIM